MGKSKIIKELANNETTVDVALKKLLVLASDLGDSELVRWTRKELFGYELDDKLPDYRIVKNLRLYFTGISGIFELKHQPLQISLLSPDTVSKIETHRIIEPISNVIENSQLNHGSYVVKDRTYLAKEVYVNSGGGDCGLQCVSITQEFDPATWTRVINKLNIILLEVFIKLDKEYGNLDNLVIDLTQEDKTKIEKTRTEVHQIIYNGCTFNDNSKNVDKSKVQHSNIATDSNDAKQTVKNDKRKSKGSVIGGRENKLEKKTEVNAKAKFDFKS